MLCYEYGIFPYFYQESVGIKNVSKYKNPFFAYHTFIQGYPGS